MWYRDIAFRNGVYQCQIPEGSQDRLKVSLAIIEARAIVEEHSPGFSHLPTTGHLRCLAGEQGKRVQPIETCGKFTAANFGAAGCSRVRDLNAIQILTHVILQVFEVVHVTSRRRIQEASRSSGENADRVSGLGPSFESSSTMHL